MNPGDSDIKIDHDNEGVYPPDGFTGLWEFHWPNGQLKFRGNYVDGKEHGEATCWWENGTLAQTGRMEFGVCKGVWPDYFENGFKYLETDYGDGGDFVQRWYSLNGEVERFEEYRNGIKIKEMQYKKKKRVIVRWYSYKEGAAKVKLERAEEWRNGIKVKETEYTDKRNFFVRWYSGGEVERVDEWRDGRMLNDER